jgi:hypothetical protein
MLRSVVAAVEHTVLLVVHVELGEVLQLQVEGEKLGVVPHDPGPELQEPVAVALEVDPGKRGCLPVEICAPVFELQWRVAAFCP